MAKGAELALILSLVDEVSKTARSIKGELGDVGKTSQGLKGTLSEVQQGLAGIGKAAIIGGIGIASAAVSGLSAAMGKLAVDALPLQGVQAAFAGITGNADAMIAKLREGSLGMVRDKDLMMSYNSAAQLVSKTFADQLPDAMGYLSKVSAATGQDMGFMIDSLVKGVGRLSPMILDNLGIQVSLTEANEAYAASIGKSVDELTKEEQQAALMAQVMEKLAANTADMPEVAGTAAQQWASFGATMANFKDRVGLALIPVLQAILEPLGKLLEEHGPRLVELFETQIVPVIQQVAEAFGMLLEGDIQGALTSLFGPEIAGQIMTVAEAIGGFVSQVATFVQEHSEEFKAALIAIGAIIAAATIYTGIMSIVAAIGSLLNPVTLVIAAVALLAAAWAGNWGGIQEKTQAVVGWISEKINAALTFVKGLWDQHGEQIMATVAALWAWVQNAFSVAVSFVQGLIQGALAAIQSFWDNHKDTILRVVGNLWDSVKLIFEGAFNILKGLVTAVIAVFKGDWRGFGEALRGIVETLWNTVKGVFNRAFDSLKTIVKDLIKSIGDFFRNTDWGAVGKSVIEGIGNGIKNAAGFLADAAKNAAQAALDAAKGFLGIKSPSERFRKEVGRPSGEGFGLGFMDSIPGLQRVLQGGMNVLVGAAPVASPALAPAAVGGSVIVVNLTYSPTVSLATEREVYDVLAPVITEIQRRERRRTI